MADPTGISGNCINKILIEPLFEWKKNLKAMRNNTESLGAVRYRLQAAIGEVRRKVKAAEPMLKGSRAISPVPKAVDEWQTHVHGLEMKVTGILRKARKLYPRTASPPADAWTRSWVKLKFARTKLWVKYAPRYANKVVKYEKVVREYLDNTEASTKETMDRLLQAPEDMSSLSTEMKKLERLRDDIDNILNGVKYRVDWPQVFRSEKRAWQGDIEVMRAEVNNTKEDYSNKIKSASEITSDWLVAFNEKTRELVRTNATHLKSRGVELKKKAKEHVAHLDDAVIEMEDLKNAMGPVSAREKTIQDRVAVAELNRLVPRRDVLDWLKKVGQAKSKFAEANAGLQKLTKSNGNGSTSLARWQELRVKVAGISKSVAKLTAFEFQDVVDHARQRPPMPEPLENVIGQGKYLEMARREIKAADVGIIGIYGDGGVGKSTLLSTIHSDATIIRDFDVVIKIDTRTLGVPMSSDMNLTEGKIQEAMMERLGFVSDAKYRKREKIWNALQDKKSLILIDNIWGTLDLGKIGVPLTSAAAGSAGRSNNNNNSKVIFTTRFERVVNGMGAVKRIKVTCLDQREARELFEQALGEDTLKEHREIPGLAKQVADKCQGLPLALKLIGAAMRNEGSHIEGWKYGLRTLAGTNGQETFEGVDELYSRLALSYHLLPSDLIKQCFLYCSLFPDNYLIPSKTELITSWMGEEFFDDCKTVKGARQKGSYIIETLKRACLVEVETNYYNEFVTMHDVVRGMARWIVSKDEERKGKFVIDTSATPTGQERDSSSGLLSVCSYANDWPDDVQRVYVGGSRTHGFTDLILGSKNCNKLSTLIFHRSKLERFEDGCFASMPNLRVLNLSRAGIKGLQIGEEKELGQLRFLRLWHTDQLRQLPEIGLANVKILLVNNPGWKGNSQIGPLIKRLLSQLWVLSMYDPTLENMQRLEIADLQDAPRLQELTIAIQTQSNLTALAGSSRLAKRVVRLSVRVADNNNRRVFNLLEEVGTFNKLLVLNIERCPSLEQIKVKVDTNSPVLQSLERLSISGNKRLQRVKVGHRLPSCALQKLRAFVVDSCSSFTILALGSLTHTLEYLEISTCTALVQILHIGRQERDSLVFQKLKVIVLHKLPKLTAICKDQDGFSFPSLKKLKVNLCPKLKRLPPAIHSSILAGEHSIVDA